MIQQLSFIKKLFPCDSAVCKSNGEVTHKVTTTYYPHGKKQPRAWTHVGMYCEDCVKRMRNTIATNHFVSEYNDIKIEKL